MSAESEALSIIKYSVFDAGNPQITDWDAALAVLSEHAILPMVKTPEGVSWLNASRYNNLKKFILHGAAVNELNTLFARPVIFKGFAAAQYYPHPADRTMGDIDFMPMGEDFDEAVEIMKKNGFVRTDKAIKGYEYLRHMSFEKNGVCYEMHRYFSFNEDANDKRLDQIIKEAVPVKRQADSCSFYALPDAENGLVLLEHIEHHIKTGVGLRQIIDWACYVEKFLTDDVWEHKFAALTRETGLEKLAIFTTALTEKYLGTTHRRFSEAAEEATVDLFMEEILDAGNFGERRDFVAGKIASYREESNIFKKLQRSGMYNWKYAWTHNWVRPFAWIYQIIRIVGILLKKRSFNNANDIYQRHDRLFRELEICKYRK